jgi:hypothetical protein
MDDVDRRCEIGEPASCGFEVAEAGQTAQVAPISAGPVAVEALRQKPAQLLVANGGSHGAVLTRIQAWRWPGLVSSTTQGSCPWMRISCSI